MVFKIHSILRLNIDPCYVECAPKIISIENHSTFCRVIRLVKEVLCESQRFHLHIRAIGKVDQ
jgi:hypothetical protein